MKRFKQIISGFIAALIVLGLVFFGLQSFQQSSVAKKKPSTETVQDDLQKTSPKLEKAEVKTKRAESKYPGIDILIRSSNSEQVSMHEQYPAFEAKSINDPIQSYMEKIHEAFKNKLSSGKYQKQNGIQPYYYANFKVFPFSDQKYSVVINIEQFIGSANSEQMIQPFMVDLAKERMIDPAELFDSTKYNHLADAVYEKLAADEELAPYLSRENFDFYLESSGLMDRCFFTEEGISFVFNFYDIAARAAGAPVAELTYAEIEEFLNEDGKLVMASAYPNKAKENEADKNAGTSTQINPAPNPSQPSVDMPAVVTHNPQAGKKVALTFDDGPHPQNTPAILNLLKQYNAKATFYMLGSTADFYPNLVKEVAQAGHEIGNHSWSHYEMTTIDDATIRKEIELSDQAIRSAIGYAPATMRPPFGSHDARVDALVGKPIVLWSIDTRDWESRDPNAVLGVVQQSMHDGAIILMHDSHGTTVEATRLVLDYLAGQGYEFVTISELFK